MKNNEESARSNSEAKTVVLVPTNTIVKRSAKEVVIEVEKGLILEVIKNNKEEMYVKIRTANTGEKQKEIEGHYGYKAGKNIRYIF